MERQGACRGPDTSKPEVVSPQKTFMSSGSWQGPGPQPWTKAVPRCQRGRPRRDGNPAEGSDPGEGVYSGSLQHHAKVDV